MKYNFESNRDRNFAYRIAVAMGVPETSMTKLDKAIEVRSDPITADFEQDGKKKTMQTTSSKQFEHAVKMFEGKDQCGSKHEDVKKALGL